MQIVGKDPDEVAAFLCKFCHSRPFATSYHCRIILYFQKINTFVILFPHLFTSFSMLSLFDLSRGISSRLTWIDYVKWISLLVFEKSLHYIDFIFYENWFYSVVCSIEWKQIDLDVPAKRLIGWCDWCLCMAGQTLTHRVMFEQKMLRTIYNVEFQISKFTKFAMPPIKTYVGNSKETQQKYL